MRRLDRRPPHEIRDELRELWPIVYGLPELVKMESRPAYGASLHQKAVKIERKFFVLHVGVSEVLDVPVQLPVVTETALMIRNRLRRRAGLPLLDATPLRRMPPLDAAEHVVLGSDLNWLHNSLVCIHVDLAHSWGVTSSLAGRVRRVLLPLDSLLSKLDDIVCRFRGENVLGVPYMHVYYGSEWRSLSDESHWLSDIAQARLKAIPALSELRPMGHRERWALQQQ